MLGGELGLLFWAQRINRVLQLGILDIVRRLAAPKAGRALARRKRRSGAKGGAPSLWMGGAPLIYLCFCPRVRVIARVIVRARVVSVGFFGAVGLPVEVHLRLIWAPLGSHLAPT